MGRKTIKSIVSYAMLIVLVISMIISGTNKCGVYAQEYKPDFAGVYVYSKNYGNCVYHEELRCKAVYTGDLWFRWSYEIDGKTEIINDWSKEDTLNWTPERYGTYHVKCEAMYDCPVNEIDAENVEDVTSIINDAESDISAFTNAKSSTASITDSNADIATYTDAEFETATNTDYDYTDTESFIADKSSTILCKYCPYLKAVCQMPNPYGDGALIGIQADKANEYSFEMLVMDLNKYQRGEAPWIYSTGLMSSESDTVWAVWYPEYGVYFTLFRLYDKSGVIVDEYIYSYVCLPDSSYGVYDENTSLFSPEYSEYANDIKDTQIVADYNMQNADWLSTSGNSIIIGAPSEYRAIEGIRLKLANTSCPGSIVYSASYLDGSWESLKSDGEISGDLTGNKLVQSFRFELTGEISKFYDVYYRAYIDTFGWQGWAKNGEACGSQNYYRLIQAVEIRLVPKNSEIDITTGNAVKTPETIGDATIARYAREVITKETKRSMTRLEKLRACYDWCVREGRYIGILPKDVEGYTLDQYYAKIFFETQNGNCYCFNSAFCEMAKMLGYDAKLVYGYLIFQNGSKTPHGWVEIGGKTYDPQQEWRRHKDCFGNKYLEYEYE